MSYYTEDYRPAPPDPCADFTRSVEAVLQARRVPFDWRELREFVSGMWPWVEGGSPALWADAFQEASRHVA